MENWEELSIVTPGILDIFPGDSTVELVGDEFSLKSGEEMVVDGGELPAVVEQGAVRDNSTFLLVNEKDCEIKCQNCEELFSWAQFQDHVCEFDEFQKKINGKPDREGFLCSPVKIFDETEHPCFAQLRENTIRLKKYIKEELKVDTEPLVTSKKKDGPHDCSICARRFVHASGLVRHMEKHTLDNLQRSHQGNSAMLDSDVAVKCLICGRIFPNPKAARKHLESSNHTVEDDVEEVDHFIPTERNIEFSMENLKQMAYGDVNWDRNLPRNYLAVVVLTFVLQCEFCDFIFMDKTDLLLHTSCHDPTLGFMCTNCEINVPTSKEILSHWQFECPFMREATQEQIHLQSFYLCNVCDTKFATLDALYSHRYKTIHLFPRLCCVTNELMITCECCGLLCTNANELMHHYEGKHLRKPKKEVAPKYRQYLCDVCGKSYTQSSHLWQHLRFHRGVKPFMCREEGCTRRFTIRPDLNDHIRKCHTGERPYHCLVCGKRFLTGSVYYQHRLIHRGERRYGCEECGKRFYRADALKNHLRIHTGEKPFGCNFCQKKFRQRGDRDKHMRARHARNDHRDEQENTDPVLIGNIAFPRSMFVPLLKDIDGKK